MERLQRLEISKGYVGLLKEAEDLRYAATHDASPSSANLSQHSKQALSSIQSDPPTAIEPYSRLRSIVVSLKEAQPAAEGAAPHLVDYTEKLASALREQLKKFLGDRLKKTLASLKWPTREMNITDRLLDEWRADVELLLDLQTPCGPFSYESSEEDILTTTHRELPHRDTLISNQESEPPVLFPLEVMVNPLDLRFKYHFSGDKPTNRLDKVWMKSTDSLNHGF